MTIANMVISFDKRMTYVCRAICTAKRVTFNHLAKKRHNGHVCSSE